MGEYLVSFIFLNIIRSKITFVAKDWRYQRAGESGRDRE